MNRGNFRADVTYVSLTMLGFVLWLLLFLFCWPLALVALVLYPIVWLLLIPFRIAGIAVEGVLELVFGLLMLPFRMLGVRTNNRVVRR